MNKASSVSWIISSYGNGTFLSAALLQGYESERNVLILKSSSISKTDRQPKIRRPSKLSSTAEKGVYCNISNSSYTNKFTKSNISYISLASKGCLVAGVFDAFEESVLIKVLEKILAPLLGSDSVSTAHGLNTGELLVEFAAVLGTFTLFFAYGSTSVVFQRLHRETICKCEGLPIVGTYQMFDLFVQPVLGKDMELARICNSFWTGDKSIVPAGQTCTGEYATSTIFLRRELYFALDRYIAACDSRYLSFAFVNQTQSCIEVNRHFLRLPNEVVEALRLADDGLGLTEKRKPEVVKPKGYLASFNLYVKATRPSLMKDREMKKLSNNEVNKILGQRWNALSSEERKPFEESARLDKIRYLEEVRVYNASAYDQVATRLKSEDVNSSAPILQTTGYMQFTNQERAFVIQCFDNSFSMAKYLSSRWQNMSAPEKGIYEAMGALFGRIVVKSDEFEPLALDTDENAAGDAERELKRFKSEV
jgi:hypothetical protein